MKKCSLIILGWFVNVHGEPTINSILSIEKTSRNGFKGALKESLGAAIATVCPRRTAELFQSPSSAPSGIRDKAIMSWLKRRALNEGASEFFERLHLDFWSSDDGAVFSANCDHRFEDLFLSRQQEDFEVLLGTWDRVGASKIVEFGCCSGLLLSYLTQHLDNVESAVGIDINPTQIAQNQQSDAFDPRMKFLCADGADWLSANGEPATLFVSNGGVLEYFTRERLEAMLTRISGQLRPAIFFASEPIAADHDWNTSTDSIPFGKELSFSHNYVHLFQSNGFEVIHQRAVGYDQWKMMCTIAVTV